MIKGQYQFVDKHYQGRLPFPEPDPNGPINRQNQFSADLTYAPTPRWNVSVNVPLQASSFAVRRPVPGTHLSQFPTGKAGRTDDVFGRQAPVDTSVQTGDKAWGWTLGVQAFRDLRVASVYGTAA